ncbi:RNA polymerase sigma factor [Nonomuraea soli]|uniref:RNA polymerase sigma factor (Sigma-70 family) n=1 Tax=Nonomuraea soli TaxID=1032476 RepID=A0A7W0HSG2_9ACTN|nr:RNA polymerase sigma factor [Nonomuraea soli]MBA2893621.1 RNA polymerase sigma factor (sigma-70 family) [Nonomuraea soli]
MPGWPKVDADDRQLMDALRRGDRQAPADLYDAYAERLHDYACSLLAEREATAQAVHDALVTAQGCVSQLKESPRLRSWLYALTRFQCATRFTGNTSAPPPVLDDPDDAELAELVHEALGELSRNEREVLELSLRHGLSPAEVGAVLGLTSRQATTRLGRARDHLENGAAAVVLARTGRAHCPDLSAMVDSWEGPLTPLLRRRLSGHIGGCEVCTEGKHRKVSAARLLDMVPVAFPPISLRRRVIETSVTPERRAAVMEGVGGFDKSGFPVAVSERGRRGRRARRERTAQPYAAPVVAPADSAAPATGAHRDTGPATGSMMGPATEAMTGPATRAMTGSSAGAMTGAAAGPTAGPDTGVTSTSGPRQEGTGTTRDTAGFRRETTQRDAPPRDSAHRDGETVAFGRRDDAGGGHARRRPRKLAPVLIAAACILLGTGAVAWLGGGEESRPTAMQMVPTSSPTDGLVVPEEQLTTEEPTEDPTDLAGDPDPTATPDPVPSVQRRPADQGRPSSRPVSKPTATRKPAPPAVRLTVGCPGAIDGAGAVRLAAKGGTLTWTAATSAGLTISPATGTLRDGASVTLSVSVDDPTSSGSGTVAVSSNGGSGGCSVSWDGADPPPTDAPGTQAPTPSPGPSESVETSATEVPETSDDAVGL